jgi:outer membrane protein OmpA-like peptidoglycan-associated protein
MRASKKTRLTAALFASCLGASPAVVSAAEPAAAPVSTEVDAGGEAAPPGRSAMQWLTAVEPRRHMFEVGGFGGVWLPSRALELHYRNLPFQRYERVTGELGLRLGYYPLRHFGFEGELAMMPSRIETDQRVFVSTARAHAVLQLGLSRLVPFALIGGGVLSLRSEQTAIGNDADQAMHVGGGLKLFLDRHIQLRLDVRDVLSPKRGRTVDDPADSIEVLLGFTLALGPRYRKRADGPPDADGDGKLDSEDKCPYQAAKTEDGCPFLDRDDDGFEDRVDECPEEAGAAPAGCPLVDGDDDGFLDVDDACPTEAGVDPDGCPLRDVDGDGLLAPADKCPTEPETRNGFEDADGCPDDIPEEVKAFTGVIEGIEFDTARATIRPASTAKLDAAVDVLQRYPGLRIQITGHTDDRGKHDKNVQLSQARADAVRDYFVAKGIASDRIETEGLGPDSPIEDNTTKAGRQKNRRIEFELLQDAAPSGGDAAPKEPAAAPPDPEPASPEAAPEETPDDGAAPKFSGGDAPSPPPSVGLSPPEPPTPPALSRLTSSERGAASRRMLALSRPHDR